MKTKEDLQDILDNLEEGEYDGNTLGDIVYDLITEYKDLLDQLEQTESERDTHMSIAEEAIGALKQVNEAGLGCIEKVDPSLVDMVATTVRNLTSI